VKPHAIRGDDRDSNLVVRRCACNFGKCDYIVKEIGFEYLKIGRSREGRQGLSDLFP